MQEGIATDVWKTTIAHYLESAKDLLSSMQRIGFDRSCPIPIDLEGEIMNGSHRVACAKALGIEEVPALKTDARAWAPAWDRRWFIGHGMSESDVSELERELGL